MERRKEEGDGEEGRGVYALCGGVSVSACGRIAKSDLFSSMPLERGRSRRRMRYVAGAMALMFVHFVRALLCTSL